MTDFDLLYPHQAQFLRQLSAVLARRRIIEADPTLTDDGKRQKISQLTVGDSSTNIDDIGYVFPGCFYRFKDWLSYYLKILKITVNSYPVYYFTD